VAAAAERVVGNRVCFWQRATACSQRQRKTNSSVDASLTSCLTCSDAGELGERTGMEPVRDRRMVGVDGISLAVHPGRYFIHRPGRGPHAVGSRDRGQDFHPMTGIKASRGVLTPRSMKSRWGPPPPPKLLEKKKQAGAFQRRPSYWSLALGRRGPFASREVCPGLWWK